MRIALIGNPNSGKTTLFNRLTGSSQKIGNFPGVTVEKKEGKLKNSKNITLIDLPGIYSLSPYTIEETVTRDFLLNGEVDYILNIIDINNIERNLYLTLQLAELNIPMLIAFNMMDEFNGRGGKANIKLLSQSLGIPCAAISANKNQGIAVLTIKLKNLNQNKFQEFYSGAVKTAFDEVKLIINSKVNKENFPIVFITSKIMENDEIILAKLKLSANEIKKIDNIIGIMENSLNMEREAALADNRYNFITDLCSKAIKKGNSSRTIKIDRFLTNKYLGLPVFFLIMLLIFWLTFDLASSYFGLLTEKLINFLGLKLIFLLNYFNINSILKSLVIDGIYAGISSVLSFLPMIFVLFMLLSFIEDTGYMARIAFITDKLLCKIGLSGRSFVSMLLGFGCSVPAIMSTRTLPNENDRKMTIMLIPFMSCSAKLPIYALMTSIFFPENSSLVIICLYFGGIFIGILSALFLKSTLFKGEYTPFVMEFPQYRMPSAKNIFMNMKEKTKDFALKAFTIIFIASIVIWFLRSFDTNLNFTNDSGASILAAFGRGTAIFFKPLGFGNWKAVTALLTGLTAKEAVISTLTILTETTGDLHNIFPSQASALSFLIFTLLYMPCFATMAAVKREINSIVKAIGIMAYQTFIAYFAAFTVYHIANL